MTDFISDLTEAVVFFARAYPLIFLGARALLAFLIYRKPMFFLVALCLGLLLVGVVYIIMDTASSGVSKKERLIHQEAQPENIFRPPALRI